MYPRNAFKTAWIYIVLVVNPLKMNKEQKKKKLKKYEIRDMFMNMNKIKLVFNLTWYIEILKIEIEEQLLIKYYVINH